MSVGADLQRVAAQQHQAAHAQPGVREQQDQRAVLLAAKQRQVLAVDDLIEQPLVEPLGGRKATRGISPNRITAVRGSPASPSSRCSYRNARSAPSRRRRVDCAHGRVRTKSM